MAIDVLAPPSDAAEVWARLAAHPPSAVAVLKPDHVRDVDLFARRYGARAYGPSLFWRDDIPETELQPVEPGTELPGGLLALRAHSNARRGRIASRLAPPDACK